MSTDRSAPALLVDDVARRRIETDLGATLFVQAGAGTGKTRALVGRVVEIVASGRARLGQLAAITFTEAAAAELRARIGARLAELALERPGDERLLVALGELDDAVVTTIHGFAHRILSDHPLPAGLPLRVRVLDDFQADLEFDRRFARFLDELLDESESREVVAAAISVGISPRHIRQLAWQVDEAWDTHAARAAAAGRDRELASLPARLVRDVATVADAMGEACALMAACTDAADLLCVELAGLVPHLGAFDPSASWLDQLRWLAGLPAMRVGNKGAKTRWSLPVTDARELAGAYDAARRAGLDEARDGVLRALLHRLGRAAGEAADERLAAGTLRFHDLLVHARDLLASDPVVRAAVQRRYVQVLVDEFQDTDALQLEIVRLVAGELDDGRPRPGRLFFVGDPKQAIYRFRGADIALYERVRSEVAGGEATELVTNFRSVPGVLEWVNRTFEQLMEDSPDADSAVGDTVRGGWLDLAPARSEMTSDVAVTVLGGPVDGVDARSRRRKEAVEIASVVAAAVGGGWHVADSGGMRAARFSDIALLLPSRTGLDELESAFDERDVPYRVQSSTLVYGSSEVRDLIACLRAVDSPGDESAILAALRTPEFACSDEDLLDYRLAGGQWRVDVDPPAGFGDHRVGRGLREIRRLHDRRHTAGIVGTLEAIVADRRVLQLAAGLRRYEEAWRRVLLVLDHARGFVDAGGRSIAELLAWTDRQAEQGARTPDPIDDGDDAVRILTVHGAKGLEFPIVVLADLGAAPPVRRGPTVLEGPDGGVEVRLVMGVETAGYALLAASDAELERAEQVRLCYVGATRARDHLVVSLHHSPSPGSPSLAELLWGACQAHPGTWRRGTVGGDGDKTGVAGAVGSAPATCPDGRAAARRAPEGDGPGTTAGFASRLTRRDALIAALRRPVTIAAASLEQPGSAPRRAGHRRVPPEPDADRRDEGLTRWHGRRAATELGRAVHAVLQRVDLSTGADLDSLAALEAGRHGLPERTAEVSALVRSAIDAPVVRAAARSRSLYRELPVAAALAGGMVEGVVDLCFTDSDGDLVLVDYKTDSLGGPGEVDDAARRYRCQVGAYALALELVLGRPVDRCVLVFLAPPAGAVEHEVADLGSAALEARAEIERRLAGRAASPSQPLQGRFELFECITPAR